MGGMKLDAVSRQVDLAVLKNDIEKSRGNKEPAFKI